MRLFVGILVTILLLVGAVLSILALWGIQPISWTLVWKSGLTVMIVCGALLMLYLFYYLFFKKYNHNKGKGKAHPVD